MTDLRLDLWAGTIAQLRAERKPMHEPMRDMMRVWMTGADGDPPSAGGRVWPAPDSMACGQHR
jgi:hypothetical protein